jgi:hypothetical protein
MFIHIHYTGKYYANLESVPIIYELTLVATKKLKTILEIIQNWKRRIYLLVCKKKIHSFILVYFKYLFISCAYKKNNSFILVYFCQRSQAKLSLQNLQKTTQANWLTFRSETTRIPRNAIDPDLSKQRHGWSIVPTQKCMKWLRCCTSAQITSFLMNCASNAKIV